MHERRSVSSIGFHASSWEHLSAAALVAQRLWLRHPGREGGLRWRPVDPPGEPGWRLQLRLGELVLDATVAQHAWSDWSPTGVGSSVPAALVTAGVWHAGTPLWQALTQALGGAVQLRTATWMDRLPGTPSDGLGWSMPETGWHGSIRARTDDAWATLAASIPHTAQAAHVAGRSQIGCIPIDVRIVLGQTRLTLADMKRLCVHAVVLVDGPAGIPVSHDSREVTLLAGTPARPVAWAVWRHGRLVRRNHPRHLAGSAPPRTPEPRRHPDKPWRDLPAHSPLNRNTSMSTSTSMASSHDAPAAGAPSGEQLDLNAVETEVRFEIARQQWPLGALAQWRVGEALPFDVPLAQAEISAWVHDRRIASGRVVVIGDRLGMRIDALGEEGPASAAAKSTADAAA